MKFTNLRFLLAIAILSLGATAFWLLHEVECRRISSPDRRYSAIVTYRPYESFRRVAPGQSSDKQGYIHIVDANGTNYGKIAVPMVGMADDLEWKPGGARLPLVGEWDFVKREYRYSDPSKGEITRSAK